MAMYEIQKANINTVTLPTLAQYNSWNPANNPSAWLVPLIDGGGDWWLLDSGAYSRYIYIVHKGKANQYTGAVNNQGIKVRPVLNLLNSISAYASVGDHVLFGDQEWVVINSTTVICYGSIGSSAFNADWKDINALQYNNSTVKDFITKWYSYWTS